MLVDIIFDALRLTAIGFGVMVIERAAPRLACEAKAIIQGQKKPPRLEPLPDAITAFGALILGLIPIFAFGLPLMSRHISWLELHGPFRSTSLVAIALLCAVLPLVAARFSENGGQTRFGLDERRFTLVWCAAWAAFSFAVIAAIYAFRGG